MSEGAKAFSASEGAKAFCGRGFYARDEFCARRILLKNAWSERATHLFFVRVALAFGEKVQPKKRKYAYRKTKNARRSTRHRRPKNALLPTKKCKKICRKTVENQ